MLHDDRRTGDYLAALAEAVRPGDVVLDVGTGSGVLAVAAARAGARRVYAVEASDIAEVAERVFAANGVQDQVTLVRGWSRQIELPEQADLLVSEIIGNEPFEEEILETTLDARRRLLKPQARMIPRTLTLLARPLLIPDTQARQRAIGHDDVERWRCLYGIELQPLLDAAIPGPVHAPTEGEVVAGWPPVGPPVVLATLDLTTLDEASVDAGADLVLDAAGAVNAVAVTFRADLRGDCDGVRASEGTPPDDAGGRRGGLRGGQGGTRRASRGRPGRTTGGRSGGAAASRADERRQRGRPAPAPGRPA